MHYLDDPKNASVPSRIWAKTDRASDCWLWTGPRQRNGYGYTNVWKDGRWQHERVHRIACELTHGPMPPRGVAMHSCDVNYAPGDLTYRRCVRPTHIHPGSQSANIQEMYDKGRRDTSTNARGERSGNAKLTDDAIRTIRGTYTGRYGQLTALARQFNTSISTIQRVATGDTWQHIEGAAEPVALRVRGDWGTVHEHCADCGLTERPHASLGMCDRCYGRMKAREKYAANRAKGLTSQGKPRHS